MDISYTRVSGYLGSVILMLVGCKGGGGGLLLAAADGKRRGDGEESRKN